MEKNISIKEIVTNKAGFVMYTNYWDKYFKELLPSQVYEIIKAIFHYNLTGEVLEQPELVIRIVLNAIIDDITRDAVKREKKAIASRANGAKNKKDSTPKKPRLPEKPTKEIILPIFIDKELWLEFMQIRKKLKAVNSERAINTLLNKLKSFHDEGIDCNQVINNSIVSSWKDVYKPKEVKNGSFSKRPSSISEQYHNTLEQLEII